MWKELFIAFALLLVIEGILPFINPNVWRNSLLKVSELNNNKVRLIGFLSMMSGVILLYLIQ
ncbi:DUF2065 domain-containing protein [Candidatus Marithrix sp. Canyon 246]|uniref:DUF2065 domain-containing protein n=1 Tax=Candidatus Marithrix sp. Canyon 246 TaxID=1827136 RepID=UPI000849F579|nr:DUF2065 domain-containing protein [Candidatus Marithrix sp. Canyon 246]